MSDGRKILFIDTNAFLQLIDLKDIPWRDLFPGVKAVDLVVAACVIDELDKHKSGTNQRRRDRARLALQLIDKTSRAPHLALVLRDDPMSVRIVISTAPRFHWDSHPNLDPANPDDQLVAAALSFGNGAAVFSHDTGPRIRARIVEIEAYEPDSKWLLPVEQTDDQRENSKLRRDLERALSQSPKIIAKFENFDETTSEIRVILPVVQPLDAEQVDRLTSQYLGRHPRGSFPATSHRLAWQLGAISEAEVERYYADYSSFQTRVREYYAHLHEYVKRTGATAAIAYGVKNDSGVTAQGLRIEFDLEGNGSLLAERDNSVLGRGVSFKEPKPPEKPQGVAHLNTSFLRDIPTLQDHMRPRDPVGFYWFERPKPISTHSALQCAEFRATREFYDSIFIMALDEPPVNFGLHLHISAVNLPSPVNISAKIVMAWQPVEWSDPTVQGILPEHVRKLV